jgi:hypothetical protein
MLQVKSESQIITAMLSETMDMVREIRAKLVESAPSASTNSAMDAMREISAVINGRGDNVTKVLKCKDVLARHQ